MTELVMYSGHIVTRSFVSLCCSLPDKPEICLNYKLFGKFSSLGCAADPTTSFLILDFLYFNLYLSLYRTLIDQLNLLSFE